MNIDARVDDVFSMMVGDAMWKHVDPIPGWLTREEAWELFSLAFSVADPSSSVVELGAWQGRSSVCLALALKMKAALTGLHRSLLVSIDTHHGSPEHQPGASNFDPSVFNGTEVDTWNAYLHNLKTHGVYDYVLPLRSDTVEAARYSWRVSLLFVDAEHTKDAVLRDVAAWERWLVPEAVVVFHDYGTFTGVTQAVASLVRDQGWRFIGYEGTLGILRPPVRPPLVGVQVSAGAVGDSESTPNHKEEK